MKSPPPDGRDLVRNHLGFDRELRSDMQHGRFTGVYTHVRPFSGYAQIELITNWVVMSELTCEHVFRVFVNH